MNVSSMSGTLDRCGVNPCIIFAYGYTPARCVLRGGRAAELLAGGGAARCDAAGGKPADSVAREAARRPAARSFGTARRADRGRPPALPERAAPARRGGAAARRARRGGRGRAQRTARDRRVDGTGRDRAARRARGVPAAAPGGARRAVGV